MSKTMIGKGKAKARCDPFVAYAPVAMAVFDSEMRYIAASERWLSDYRLSSSPVGLLYYDVFPETPEAWKAVHRRCLAGATESSEGDPLLRATGRLHWLKWSACPWRGSDSEIGGIIITTEDITRRKEAEADAEHCASVVTHSIEAISAKTLDSVVTIWNAGATRLLGFSGEEMIGRSIARIIPPERLGEENQIRERLRAGESIEHFETQRIAKDGSVLDVSLSISPMRDFRGSIVGTSTIMRDITAQIRTRHELESTEAILDSEHESSPDGILVVDRMGRILSFNRSFRDIFDIPHELITAQEVGPVLEFAMQWVLDREELDRRTQNLYVHPDESAHDELVLKDGRVLDRFTSSFKSAGGEQLGRIWFFRDITARRKGEETLRASEQRFRLLVEEAPDAILLYDVDQDRIVAANKAAECLFGASRDEILQGGPQRFFAPEPPVGRPAAESPAERNESALAGEEMAFERRVRRPSGEERVCQVNLVRLPSNVRLLRASLVDITEQRAAEAQLSEIALSTVRRQEDERQRIARELHDSIGQYLAGMTMKLDALGQSAPDASPLKSGLAELKSLTTTVGSEMGRLAWELRPAALDDLGLEAAIERFVEEWTRRSGLRFDLHCSLSGRRLPPDVETTLYRVLQEAVTNIVKHAGARKVGVSLDASPRDVVMTIEDDGKGFEQEAVNRRSTRHFGLLGMRERLALVRGSMEIESKPGAGTTLIIRVPLRDPAAPSF